MNNVILTPYQTSQLKRLLRIDINNCKDCQLEKKLVNRDSLCDYHKSVVEFLMKLDNVKIPKVNKNLIQTVEYINDYQIIKTIKIIKRGK